MLFEFWHWLLPGQVDTPCVETSGGRTLRSDNWNCGLRCRWGEKARFSRPSRYCGRNPAISQYVDVLGHTASACCHLCRFITILGSTYASGICRGMQSYSSSTAASAGGGGCSLCGLSTDPVDELPKRNGVLSGEAVALAGDELL